MEEVLGYNTNVGEKSRAHLALGKSSANRAVINKNSICYI
jgi:hypothetical protein